MSAANSSSLVQTFSNFGANATLNIRATPALVRSASCHNENAAERYLQLHDIATVPTTTVTVPKFSFLVPAGAQIIVGTDFFTEKGIKFTTGLAFAFSTTKDVYTAATASEQTTHVNYE